SAKHELTSMHRPTPSARARSSPSAKVVTKLRSSRSGPVCSTVSGTAAARASAWTGARASARRALASSHSRPSAGPVVSTRQPPSSPATSTADRRRSCWSGQVAGSARSHPPSSTMLLTRRPASRRRAHASPIPASSSFRYDSPTWSTPVADHHARSSSNDQRQLDTALTDSRGCTQAGYAHPIYAPAVLFLVTGRIEGTSEPTAEFLQASHDTLELLGNMQRDGKVHGGGVFIGPLGVCFIVDAESNDDLHLTLTTLPAFRFATWEAT